MFEKGYFEEDDVKGDRAKREKQAAEEQEEKGENDDSVEDDLGTSSSDDDENALSVEDRTDIVEPDDDVAADEENQEAKALPGGDNSDIKSQPEEKLLTEPSGATNAKDFVGLADDEKEDRVPKQVSAFVKAGGIEQPRLAV